MSDLNNDKNRRVLIVDDNRAIHGDFRKILAPDETADPAFEASELKIFGNPAGVKPQTRFQVDSAYQGEEGVALVKKAAEAGQPYAMAFVDVRMPPGMDGVETTQKIWAIDPEIQIVVCTAYSDISWNEMLEKIGGNGQMVILKKPFDAVEAFQLARTLTEKWRMGRLARQKMEDLEGLVAVRTRELLLVNQTLEMHARVIENMTEAVIIADEQGEIVTTNPACDDMFGYKRGELAGRHFSILYDLDEVESRQLFDDTVAYLQHELSWSGEVKRRKKDGTVSIVQAQISVFEIEGRRHYFSIQSDITGRKHAEELLLESRNRLQYLVTCNPSVIFAAKFTDRGLEPTWISDNHRQFLGHDPEATTSRAWWIDHLHPDDRERVLAEEVSPFPNDRKATEYRFRRKDGSYFWIRDEKVLIRDASGEPVEIIGSSVDITERKLAGEKMDQLRREQAAILNSIGEGVHWVGPDGRIKYENPAAAKMLGYEISELIGKPAHATMHHTRADGTPYPQDERLIYKTLRDGKVRRVKDEVFWRKDGTSFAVEYTCTPILYEDGHPGGSVIIFTDVTGGAKLVEGELRWKTAFLEANLNSSLDGILVVDRQAKKILQNQQLIDLFEIPRHIADDTDDKAQVQWVTNVVKNPAQFIEKVRYLYSHPNEISRDEIELKDGMTLDRYSSPVIGKDGIYYGRIWTFRDITASKQAEEARREQAALLRIAGRLTRTGGWRVEIPGNRVFWSDEICDILEYPRGSVPEIEEALALYLDPCREKISAALQACARDGTPFDLEVEMLTAKGRRIWVRACAEADRRADGSINRVEGALQDITDRKQFEETLRLLSSAVEQSKESIIITSAQLDLPGPEILFVNPAFTQMTGYAAEEVIGKTPRILQGPNSDRGVLQRLRTNLSEGKVFEGETVNYRKDGTEFPLEWQIVPLRDVEGTITHFVAIQRDITMRKRIEAQLFQSQKMETVGKLAGGIAHEFNSIMTAIIGQSELILVDLPAGNPLRHNATEIRQAADRVATLTRQLLAYGRKQILQPEILDLSAVICGMETVLRHLMALDVDVRVVPKPGLKSVKADAGQIEQVILNMAMNAADAMPRGGKLTLETANVTLDQEYVSRFPELKPGEYVMLAISDTGVGMSEDVKARVFEPFFSTKDVGQGTGLGLATCHGIIKQSGGHINVYSEQGRGTTFKIYLPQVEVRAKAAARRLDAPGMPRGIETILLVEDDPALRNMAAALLRRLGYTVLAAENGIEALKFTHEKGRGHIDLLFTDVVMPHMSGKELSERIRSLYPQTRILFTSAYTENAIVHQGVLDEGIALLQKPFTPSALALKIREVLER